MLNLIPPASFYFLKQLLENLSAVHGSHLYSRSVSVGQC